jgi:hypothetical protein
VADAAPQRLFDAVARDNHERGWNQLFDKLQKLVA